MKCNRILSVIFLTQLVDAQFPNFLKAFYGSSSTSTKKPIIRRRVENNVNNALIDDAFNAPPPVPNLITAGPGPTQGPTGFNNIPLSNSPLQNNYVVQPNNNLNSGPSLAVNNGPNLVNSGPGIVNAPNSFSSSPNVSIDVYIKQVSGANE